ncbi:MAG: alkaline phosphatase family protein [Candidatus Competibacteraceae bacterium]|nr:alkaline phosphatase family protein [Candidatus Competibacteraceae bacterium]
MMTLPNYRDGNLVNLMSSLASGLGRKPGLYEPLSLLPPITVASATHVVLLLIDGLGYNYLQRQAQAFKPFLHGRLTSVFPTSTAPAITTLLTGVAPQQHGVTGWFMNLKELGSVAMILPFRPRWGGGFLSSAGTRINELIAAPPLCNSLQVSCHFVIHQDLQDSPYSVAGAGRAQRRGYEDLAGFFRTIRNIITEQGRERSYIYAYWPMLDFLAHRHGIGSKTVKTHFQELEQGFVMLGEALRGTDTLLVATADHGFIDTAPRYKIRLEDHPQWMACLAAPLCGEPRVVYCYIRANKSADFERYVRENLSHACDCYPSEEVVERGWFGEGEPDPRLLARIGDYVLVTKERYVIKDTLPGEGFWADTGVHGGVSADEMLVPLLVSLC